MRKHSRTSSKPEGLGRGERGDRRSNRHATVTRTESEYENTGVFGSFGAPKLVGVSDEVRVATRDMARRAKRVEKGWSRKGQPQTKSAIHERIARMEARRAS